MHCHIDLYPHPHAIVKECSRQGMFVLSVTTTPKAWEGTKALEVGSKNIFTALGFHPQLVHEREAEMQLFERFFDSTRYIGEIGLDGSKEFRKYIAVQSKIFKYILCMAREDGRKVLSIHSRDSTDLVLNELDGREGISILHWFSGTKAQLAEAVEKGCWFSVGPGQLRTNKGKELFRLMPRNRVLTETDGPFVEMGDRSILPWDIKDCILDICQVWKCSEQEAVMQVLNNLHKLQSNFSLK